MYRIDAVIDNLELSHGLMDSDMLTYSDSNIMYFLKNLCDQQLGIKNNIDFVLDQTDDVLPTVTSIICNSDQLVVTLEVEKSIIKMNSGDVLIFPSEIKHSIDNLENCIVKKIPYIKSIDLSAGSKEFIITATLTDKYSISIKADSEEEALSKAENISISKWTHLDLYPDIKERKVIRYAKWGNFEAKPLT
jgi:hypothetical protein